ncbi:MAG: ABC transporter permease [Eubacteriales bacterium]|nr:ABC transporter permease [Eubacteriales bacterium]
MNNFKSYLKMTKYETIRIYRNKYMFVMLIIFSILLMFALSFVQNCPTTYPVAIFTDGVDIENCGVFNLIEDNLTLGEKVYVNSIDEGVELVNSNKVCFFICLDAGEENDETTAKFYYDQSNTAGRTVSEYLANAKNVYAYNAINEFLQRYGITLNESYFQLVSFESTNPNKISISQMQYSIELAVCVSIILLLGLAYSIARDNETKVSKNILYMPIGANKYLLSKLTPYFVLGFFQILIMLLIGLWPYNIHFETSLILVWLLSGFYLMSMLALSLFLSLFKSQIATIFTGLLLILVPVFAISYVYLQGNLLVQIILYLVPLTPFVYFLNAMMFNGIILWYYIPIFISQTIIYYLLALVVLKKRQAR